MEAALPMSLRDIDLAIGRDRTLAIVRNFAGQRIYIPAQLTLDWVLLPVLDYDFEAGAKIINLCGKTQITIPFCHEQIRNQEIKRDRLNMSLDQLVKKYRLSNSQIRAILKKP